MLKRRANGKSTKDSRHSLFSDTSMILYTLWEESESSSMSESDRVSELILSFSTDPPIRNRVDFVNTKRALLKEWTDQQSVDNKSRKERYSRGISVASSYIVDYITKYKLVDTNEINVVTGVIVMGEEVDFTSEIGKRFLKKMKISDRNFAKLAFMSAAKVRDLGGGEFDMEAAVICVLICRRFRYIRKSSFDEKQIEELSKSTARSVMYDYTDHQVYEKDIYPSKETKFQQPPSTHRTLPIERGFNQFFFSFPNATKYFYNNLNMLSCSGMGPSEPCSCAIQQRN